MRMVLVLNGFVFALGVVTIIGAYRRWRWLVDPPIALWPYYSQAFLKRIFGTKFVIIFTYLIGLLLMALAVLGSWIVCCRSS